VPVIQESVVIRRPPEVVFDYLSRAANLAVWDASVVNAEQIGSAPTAAGSRSHGTSKFMGRRFHWTTEVTAFDPPRQFGFRSVEGSLMFTVTTVLDPVDGGTHLTYRSETVSGLGEILGRLGDPILQRVMARTVRANLETLAHVLAAA